MRLSISQLLCFAVCVSAGGTDRRNVVESLNQLPGKIVQRSPMPPRWAPGTPPDSRRQSLDRITSSMMKELLVDDKSQTTKQSPVKQGSKRENLPKKNPKQDPKKQDAEAVVRGISPDNTAKFRQPKVSSSHRPSSPAGSYSSSDGFVRPSEMAVSKLYGPLTSSEDERVEDRKARRRRGNRRPVLVPPVSNPAPRRHYSSAESLPVAAQGSQPYYSDSSSSGLDTSSD